MDNPKLIFSPGPHGHTHRSTSWAMYHVLIALLPAVACSFYFFRLPAVGVMVVSVMACVATEWAITRFMLRRGNTIYDGSALLTGVLLALNLPSNLPLWMVAAGGVMAIGVAKMAFGGLGCNIFNPALVGRVFLLISFPVAMTSWPVPLNIDGITGPTVLGLEKMGELDASSLDITPMLTGNMGGSMGEVSDLALLAGFGYLLAVRVIKWQIPVCVILGLAAVDLLAGWPVLVDILSGGLLLGAIFMATDYVTSPMTNRGMMWYGFAIGAITAVIRRWGAYPEGVSFAILIMNGFTPLINRIFKPSRFSVRRKEIAL